MGNQIEMIRNTPKRGVGEKLLWEKAKTKLRKLLIGCSLNQMAICDWLSLGFDLVTLRHLEVQILVCLCRHFCIRAASV